jgi:hypothetical protein
MRRAATFVLVALTILVAGCGGSNESTPAEEPSSSEPTTATTESAASPIVGRWEQVHGCDQLVKALAKAGLRELAPGVVGENYFPDQSPKQLAQKPDLCRGATPQRHGHFFTEEGLFGSLDQEDNQVDDNTYEVNGDILRIGEGEWQGEFRYRIVDDAVLVLHPVIKPADRRRALARPLEFGPAGWQVAVSYDGLPWKRVDCAGWC